jgi:hypothetical protein
MACVREEEGTVKNRQLIQAVVLVASSLTCSIANAESKVEKIFETLKAQKVQGDGRLIVFLAGAGSAFTWADAALRTKGQERLFCQPDELALNGQNFADIAIKEFLRQPSRYKSAYDEQHPDQALTSALLRGLNATFPCK